MRNVTVLAVLVFGMAGIVMADTPPSLPMPPSGHNALSANYRPQVSPDIAALQAQERAALADGDKAAARELEKQVQAILIQQQNVVPRQRAPESGRQPARSGLDFAPDHLICSGVVTASAADWEMDGTMWAAFASEPDSAAMICKSTDCGTSWQLLGGFAWPPKHIIDKIELVVGEGDSGFVYLFENMPTNNGDLMVIRMGKDGTGLTGWGVREGPDTITDFSVCRDHMGGSYWLYATTVNGLQDGNFRRSCLLRSTDYGVTWATTDSIYNLERSRLAFGAGQCGYLSALPQQNMFKGQVGTGITTAFSSPGSWRYNVLWPDTFAINDAAIAPAFTTPVESATVWVAYTHYAGGDDWDVYSSYATDTMLSWVAPTPVANSGHTEGYVDLKSYTSTGNDSISLSYCDIDLAGHDNAWLGYSSSGAPGTWIALSDPWVNKSGYISWSLSQYPRIVYSPGGPGSGGGLVFTGMSGGGYFNAPWFTGVAEDPLQTKRLAAALSVTPSVARGPVRVSWNGSAARLSVTDVAGRIVRSVAAPAGNSFVWDGRVPAGTYLVCLTTRSGTATRPVVIQ